MITYYNRELQIQNPCHWWWWKRSSINRQCRFGLVSLFNGISTSRVIQCQSHTCTRTGVILFIVLWYFLGLVMSLQDLENFLAVFQCQYSLLCWSKAAGLLSYVKGFFSCSPLYYKFLCFVYNRQKKTLACFRY